MAGTIRSGEFSGRGSQVWTSACLTVRQSQVAREDQALIPFGRIGAKNILYCGSVDDVFCAIELCPRAGIR